MLRLSGSLGTLWNTHRGRFVQDESGQTMVEYVLMIVLIALVVVAAIPGVTGAISAAFTKVAGELSK